MSEDDLAALQRQVLRERAARKEAERLLDEKSRELYHASQQLRREHDNNQRYLDTVQTVMVALDSEARITMANRATCAMLGQPESALLGQPWFERFVTQPYGLSVALPLFLQLVAGDLEVGKDFPEYWVIDGQGQVHLMTWRRALMTDPEGRILGTLSSGEDITEQRRVEGEIRQQMLELTTLNAKLVEAQSQLLQAEKMASVGQLAAGVAHEINNPIGFVNSNLGSLKGQVEDLLKVLAAYKKAEPALAGQPELLADIEQAKAKADLEFLQEDIVNLINESLEGVNRVKKIVDNLKDFSRVDTAEWQHANIENGLESTLNIVWNEIKYKADVKKNYAGLPEIECIASQLNQVFMNLLVNAAHAIDERGTITLRTGFDETNVWVDIADTGKGIKPEHLNKIFEPFFTTKPVGKGTGLGLSLAYGIVQRHHGRLEVRSELGKGTVFRVTLPRVRVPDEAPAAA